MAYPNRGQKQVTISRISSNHLHNFLITFHSHSLHDNHNRNLQKIFKRVTLPKPILTIMEKREAETSLDRIGMRWIETGSDMKTLFTNWFRCKYICPFSIKITVLLFRSSVLLVTDAFMLRPNKGNCTKNHMKRIRTMERKRNTKRWNRLSHKKQNKYLLPLLIRINNNPIFW